MAKLSLDFSKNFDRCVCARVCACTHLCAGVAGFNLVISAIVESCGWESFRGQGAAGDSNLKIGVNVCSIH